MDCMKEKQGDCFVSLVYCLSLINGCRQEKLHEASSVIFLTCSLILILISWLPYLHPSDQIFATVDI
uniref:Uncharacterized protein n=1 Tax=Manihot esculenta TaxID=3983 RepID=A0A2C9WH52_MANES